MSFSACSLSSGLVLEVLCKPRKPDVVSVEVSIHLASERLRGLGLLDLVQLSRLGGDFTHPIESFNGQASDGILLVQSLELRDNQVLVLTARLPKPPAGTGVGINIRVALHGGRHSTPGLVYLSRLSSAAKSDSGKHGLLWCVSWCWSNSRNTRPM